MEQEDHRRDDLITRIVAHHAAMSRTIFGSNPNAWFELDLTLPQLKALFVLHLHGPLTATALAERLGVKRPTATGFVDRLVEHKLVQRSDDSNDRRIVWVQLSPQGASIVDKLYRVSATSLARALPQLTVRQLEALAVGLSALRDALSTEAIARPSFPPLVAAAATAPRDELSGG